MVGVSVVQVGSAVRHTPLAPLSYETEPTVNSEDPSKDLRNNSCQFPVLGGFVGGGQLAWRASGPTVEIIEPSTGTRKAAWTFGAILHNAGARVTSVCGVGPGTISQVVVGVDLGSDRKPQGMVALLCLYSSRLTRVFHFTHKVTSLCMVSGGEVSVDSGTLAPELRPWHGLLVVATAHGTLHLLDLALDLGGHKVLSDEVSPGNLLSVVTPDPQADRSRITAVMQHCHPTMCLSDGMSYGGRFHLVGPDDNILYETSSQLVVITALAFIPQLASLIVGYNFGAFQIINLSSLTIDCTSPYEDKMPPVYSFACQEPENDPKNFVYLWLCRSWGPAEGGKENKTGKENSSHALCTMYAMNYDNKVWIEGHGLWYQGLASISPRFEFDAIGGLGIKGQPAKPSKVFAAMTVRQTTPNSAATPGGSSSVSALATPDEDAGPVPEQSLCLFGWVGGVLEHGRISINHYLAVFDINQWYQAQMPSTMKLEENHLCPYMSFHELDRVPGGNTNEGLSEIVLGAAPKPASWARHMSRTCNDSDWFPAALSYDAHVLTSEGLMEYRCQSAQQAALSHLTSSGPSAIVSPEDAYAMCVFAGLISPDAHSTTTGSYMVIEREALLNVALDQQLVSLLVQCVAEFSEGRFTNLGCSLPSLLEWSWSRVCAIKTTNDNLCLPLFDPDCGVMSAESIAILHQNLTSLASLTTIITAIRDYANTNMITLQGAGELESRVQVVGLLMLHLSVVLWFYHCGLLSHTPTEDVIEDCHVPFPADLLCRIYKNRRSEIQRLSTVLVGNEVLMIDGLLEDTAGSCGSIGKAWEKEGGSGMYPPPSLHALLAMFLLPDVSTTTKHRIVQYLFLDLASLLSDGYVRVVEELVKYPSSFSLSPSHIKLTQAFWLLDHKDFQEGLNVLLDPLVNTNDITPWQHRRIMNAFLYQGEHSRALTYAQIRQPPKVDMDDIRLHLTLLLANGLIREAFHYQRSHRIKNNSEDLLNHLFTGCEQLSKLESVVHLPLSPFEEEALVSYLQASSNPSAHDYLLVYYLQRARYDEAAVLQDSFRGGPGTVKKRQGARSALVHGYLTHLPDVAKRLTSGVIRKNGPTHSIYTKPQPLSAQIRQAVSSPTSHAANINRMLDHNQEAWPLKLGTTTPYTPFRNKSQRRKVPEPIESEDFGGLFTPKRKSMTRESSHVVFPSRIQVSHSKYTEEEDGEIGLFSPAAKRSRFGESSFMRDDVSKLMESVLRKSMYGGMDANTSVCKNISSDLMSLLQTPKIMRKRKSGIQPSAESSLVDTPQSILKVRQMVQRPLSPSPASETSIPVFPRLSNKKASISEDILPNRTSDTSMTPKQLRFHLPKMRMDEDTVAKEQAEENEEEMLLDDQSIPEEVTPEKDVEEELEMNKDEEDIQELEDEVKVVEVENEEEKGDIEESEEPCVQELEDGGEIELEEEEKERERDLVQKEEEVEAVIISPSPDIHYLNQNPLRNPESGIPTPRQPLRGCVAKTASVAAILHQSDFEECIDEVDVKEAETEEQEESLEENSRDTTTNEIYYSFTEEPSKVAESVDKYITEDEDEELNGAERSKEVGDSDEDIVFLDDDKEEEVGDSDDDVVFQDDDKEEEVEDNDDDDEKEVGDSYDEKGKEVGDSGDDKENEVGDSDDDVVFQDDDKQKEEGEKEMVYIDELCSKEEQYDESKSQIEEDLLYEELYDNMDEGGSEEIEEVETSDAINQETEIVCESTSVLEGHTYDSNIEKVDNLSSSEDCVEETEFAVKEMADSMSNDEDSKTERNSEDESELSLNDTEVIKVLEYSESEPEEQQMKEAADSSSGSPHSETEEKYEDESKLSLNESEIISPLEFSESESEPEVSTTVEEKLIFKESDHAREEQDADDQNELIIEEQEPVTEELGRSSREESTTKEELTTEDVEPITEEVSVATQEESISEKEQSTVEQEEPTMEELKSVIEEEVTTKEQEPATRKLESTTMEDLTKERELVIVKEVSLTEGSSATIEDELPMMEELKHHPLSDEYNEEKESLVEENDEVIADLVEDNREPIIMADYEITEEQEMITEAISEEEYVCISHETSEQFSPLRFSDSENEGEDELEEVTEEKDRHKVEHISSSETKSPIKEISDSENEVEDELEEVTEEKDRHSKVEHISSSETKSPIKEISDSENEDEDELEEVTEEKGRHGEMPDSNTFEKKSMEVDNCEEQSTEANIPERKGDVPNVTQMEHEGETLEVVPAQGENRRVTETKDTSEGEFQGNEISGFEMTDRIVEVRTTSVVNKKYSTDLKDERVESSVTEEEKPSETFVHEDLEAFRHEEKIINRSEEVEEANENISCVVKIAETVTTTKESTVIEASRFRIAHETEATEDNKPASSEEGSHISNDEEASVKADEIGENTLTVKMDSEEMLHVEDQTRKALEYEDMGEKCYVNKNSDEEILLTGNDDNEKGAIDREGSKVVVHGIDDEYMEVMETNNSNIEVLKNQGHDKESLKSQGENVDLETEIKKAGPEKKIIELERQVLSESSIKGEEEEITSLQIESVQQEASVMAKEQKDEFTSAPLRKSTRSTPHREIPDKVIAETTVSVSPKSTRWRDSAGPPTEVSEKVPLSVSPRKSRRQLDTVVTGTTVIEETALTVSPKILEHNAGGDTSSEVAKETTLTVPPTRFNEATSTVLPTSSGYSSTADTLTTATEETVLTVSPRRRSRRSGAEDMPAMSAEETFAVVSATSDATDSPATSAEESTTTASLRKPSKQSDAADTITKAAKRKTRTASSQQNAESPLVDIPNRSVEDTSLGTSPRRILRHTHSSDLETTTTEDDTANIPEASKETPVRRSQRLRATSPHTPGTPKKTRKTISSTEVTTPVRASSQEVVDEMITRSGRKIRLVPVPITKSKSSVPGSTLVTPTRKPARESLVTEEVQKVSQKLELPFGNAKHIASSPTLEHLSVDSPSTYDALSTPPLSPTIPSSRKQQTQITSETSVVVTPRRLSRRRSTRQSTSDEALETIEEEREKTASSENEGKGASHVTTAKTPTKKTPSKSTPTKVTPRRTRRSSRQSMSSEGLETIAEDTEFSTVAKEVLTENPQAVTPSQRTRRSLAVEVSADLQRNERTPRRRRQSISGDVAETPEKNTPRRRRHSFTGDVTEDVKQGETPQKEEKSRLGNVSYEEENKTPSSKGKPSLPVVNVRRSARKQRQLSQSEEEKPKVEVPKVTSLKTNVLPSLEVLQNYPDKMATRSSGSSSVTSIKDSESSEDDDRFRKRRLSRRQSGAKMPHSPERVSEKRKSRRLTLSSTLSTVGQLQLQELPGTPSRKSLKSLKVYSESGETASLLSPDSDMGGHSLRSKKSRVGSTSVLLIEGPSEDEELILEQGLDTSRDADDEAKHSEVQESPDLPLNLLEVVGKGRRRRIGSLSHLSVGQGRRRTVLTRQSLQSLKIHTQLSQDQEDVVQTTTRRSQRYKRRSTNTSVLGIQRMQTEEKNEEVEIRTPEKEVDNEENASIKEKEEGTTVLEMEEVKESKDEIVKKKLSMVETKKAVEQEEKRDESSRESPTPKFEFATPKSVTSSRRVRALEYLTSEAVEFLFSPPQAAGRIVRHHAKVEEDAKTSSSESDAESETGKKLSHKRQK